MAVITSWKAPRLGLLERWKSSSSDSSSTVSVEGTLGNQDKNLTRGPSHSSSSSRKKTIDRFERVIMFCSVFC